MTISTEVKALLQCYSEPAILLGKDYHILAANTAYQHHYGEECLSHYCYEVSHQCKVPCEQMGEICPLKTSLKTRQPQEALHSHHTRHGETYVKIQILPIYNDEGDIIYLLQTIHDIKVAKEKLQNQGLVGFCDAFNRLLVQISRVAPRETSVLLLGESGTGKELASQAIHAASNRAQERFVPVDCSGLSESLFESEMFGHEKGAFTGAHIRKQGLVAAAQGGTLFLDEVGDIPLNLQVKLLRLLETGTYRRVGSVEPQKADFRLICATHRNIKEMVSRGDFRQDLYYRISAFPIFLPPLRKRHEDLPMLIENQLQRIMPQSSLSIHPQALQILQSYDFPGNVRELRNILERASVLADGDLILPEHLPQECRHIVEKTEDEPVSPVVMPLFEVEQQYLQWVVQHFEGDNKALAKKLGVSERTLYRKLKKNSNHPAMTIDHCRM
jgi:transcriptional regulator with PAS, ATPase and Fis domain